MAYLLVENFKAGMDRTRGRHVGQPGALYTLENAHISRGGDIERMKKWVSVYTLPSGTYGMAKVKGQLYVFGSANLAASVPRGVQYQRLQNTASAAMNNVLDARARDGKLYVIAQYADGNTDHFYDGTRVSEWDTLADTNTSASVLCAYMADLINSRSDVVASSYGSVIEVRAKTAGTAFTISATYTDAGGTNDQTATVATPVANVAAVAETRAAATITVEDGTSGAGVNTVSGVWVNGVALMSSAVDWTSSNSATAILLKNEINNNSGTHGYSATVVSNVVTITAAPGTGATPNGHAVATASTGNVVVSSSAVVSGGVTAVTAVAQISTVTIAGTFQALDPLTVTVNEGGYAATGRAAGMGTSAFVWKTRMWSTANSLMTYSKIDDPTLWLTASDGGQINMANQSEGSERMLVSAEYNGTVAMFARRSVRIWTLDSDEAKNAATQTLDNTGTMAPKSVVKYGNSDVIYLSDSGIRSLRSRDASNSAIAEDLGTAIDPYVQDLMASLTPGQVAQACGVVEPVDGRYLLAIGTKILVFSYFPAKRISAWSYYDVGVQFTDMVAIGRTLYARAGNTIYAYGGLNGDTYPGEDELVARAKTPFLSANTSATHKTYTGVDMAATNTWSYSILVNPNDTTEVSSFGSITDTTLNEPDIGAHGEGAVFALDLACSKAGPATISVIAQHYDPGKAA